MLPLLTRFLRGNRELSTLVVCVALSFAALVLPIGLKSGVSEVLSGTLLGPFKRLAAATAELTTIKGENAALHLLAAGLMDERATLLAYRHENERLRELLDFLVTFSEEETLVMTPARVIGMPGGRVIEGIELDKGSLDGIDPGMPVVVASGLVGKVSRTFRHRALVEPLTSASSAVSVALERSRVRGVVKPRFGGPAQLVSWGMDYVPARSDIRAGDVVVTSGLGGIYPPGLIVGTIAAVAEGPLTMSVSVEPAVRLSSLEQVFIVTGTQTGPRPHTEDELRLLQEVEALRGQGDGG
jgi:rod shape-determining protein MreC